MNTRRTQPYRADTARMPGMALQAMLTGRQPGALNPADFIRQRQQMAFGNGGTAAPQVGANGGVAAPQTGGRPAWEGVPNHDAILQRLLGDQMQQRQQRPPNQAAILQQLVLDALQRQRGPGASADIRGTFDPADGGAPQQDALSHLFDTLRRRRAPGPMLGPPPGGVGPRY